MERHWKSALLGTSAGLLGAGEQLILFETLRLGPAYLVFPVISLYPAVAVVLSLIFLKERASRRASVGIALALVAIGLLSYQPPSGSPAKGYLRLLLAMVSFLFLLGSRKLPASPAATKWLRAWYHLTWGRCSGKTLHNCFNPFEFLVARRHDVGGSEHDFMTCPPLAERRNPARRETHMHSLFTPLNNVFVFDGYVTPQQLEGVGLVILCGSYCQPETQAVVGVAVEKGTRCLCQKECAPGSLRYATGQQMGRGYWWTVPDFDAPDAMEQFLRFRGYHNQWILKSGLGTLRIYSTDPRGNEIAWELEPESF